MIFVKHAIDADIIISYSKNGYWIRGARLNQTVHGEFVTIVLPNIKAVKYFLRALDSIFQKKGIDDNCYVFDMSERISK